MNSIEPSKEELFAVAVKAGLNKNEAMEVFDRMQKIVRKSR